jgi:hypothetical protein
VDVSRSFRVFKLISQPLKNRRIQRVVKFSHPSFLPLVEMVVLELYALSGRSFHVPVSNTDSATHHILYGVPQGAILSSSLIQFLHSRFVPEQREWNCHICGWYCDLCVQRRSRGGLRYTATTPWFSFHVLQAVEDKFNAAKTQATYFTRCWSPR